MKCNLYLIFLMAFLHSHPAIAKTDVALLYDSLRASAIDKNKVAKLSDVIIIRGGQEIYFINGTFRLLTPVHGKVFGAVYIGQGTFTISPPSVMEKSEFERQFEWKLVDGKYVFKFDRAVLWFQDTLLPEMGLGDMWAQKDIESIENEALDRSLKYITDKSNDNILHHIMTELLEENPKPYLFGHLFSSEKSEIFFSYDLREFEEVKIYKPPYEALTGSIFWLELVNSFHLLEEYQNVNEYELVREDKKIYDFGKNTVELSIKKGGKTAGQALLNFRSINKNQKTLKILLDPKLIIDSILTTTGEQLSFHQIKESWNRFLLLPEQDSNDYSLTFFYHGDFLKPFQGGFGSFHKLSGSFYELSSSTGWYPRQLFTDKMMFDVTYRYPKDMCLVAAGQKQSDVDTTDEKITRYTITKPTMINSFSLGFYKETRYRLSDNEPLVTVFDVGGGDPERVAKDIANAMRLFTFLFGSCPYNEIKVTGGPLMHGQAFQEFIHLPWIEEYVGEKFSGIEITRAHEVAHAWWGHGVGAKSYHDYWLSEAFSHYAALLYAPFVLKNDKPLYDKLKEWREKIAEVREYALGSGPKLGSIWLGYRASSVKTPNDYLVSTYMKGALVLHMLRMMLIDLATMNEDVFKSMVKEFYQSYVGQEPTTDDFRKFIEKYFKADMRWFFNQWIYGIEIPKLKCTKSVVRSPSGKYTLSLSIEQKDVQNPFIIYRPFELKYRNGAIARARLFIDKEINNFSYELDLEPESVTFNIMESVLCSLEE